MKKFILSLCTVALACGLLGACTNREMGTTGGAVVGGVVGNAVTGGSTLGTVAGAAGGGLIGHSVSN